MAKSFFAKNKVKFDEKDVSSNEDYKKEMIEISGALAVPVIVIDEEVIVGWDEGKVRKALGLVS